MAKKVLKANIFSTSSIQELQKQLREYQDSLNKKCEIFTEELAKRGVEIAKARVTTLDAIFTGDLLNNIHEKKGNGDKNSVIFFITADSRHAAFVEFGTGQLGLEGSYPYPFPEGVEWNYNNGKTILRPENTDGSIRKMENGILRKVCRQDRLCMKHHWNSCKRFRRLQKRYLEGGNMLDMLESQVITRIKTQFSKKLKDRYPNLKFTNSDRADTVPKFPTVYIHEMTGAETGEDLQGDTINAVWSSFQIEVTTNTKMNDAKEVMNEVVRIMKTMRFQVIATPEFQNTDSTYRRVARFRRMIADGDIL